MSEVKERPILFSAPMVRAILQGRKTQTRRIMNPQPPDWCKRFGYTCFTPEGCISGRGNYEDEGPAEKFFKLKYGKRGDRLWVRETWMQFERTPTMQSVDGSPFLSTGGYLPGGIGYRADTDDCGQVPVTEDGETVLRTPKGPWRSSMYMPRRASRITLEIYSVRIERLNDISDDDALAEGVDCTNTSIGGYARQRFKKLWECIHGPESWEANPWVWRLTFRKIDQP